MFLTLYNLNRIKDVLQPHKTCKTIMGIDVDCSNVLEKRSYSIQTHGIFWYQNMTLGNVSSEEKESRINFRGRLNGPAFDYANDKFFLIQGNHLSKEEIKLKLRNMIEYVKQTSQEI